MTVRLIAAMSSEGIIGLGNDLPWSLKDDLKHFQALTMGRTVVMGSKTFDSIGGPLPGRHNIVITRNPRANGDNLTFVKAPPLLADADIIGGAQIYQHYLQGGLVDEMVITFVDACVTSRDKRKVHFFPSSFFSSFVPCFLESKVERNKENEHSFKIVKYIWR
ncbi:dihydrofolate reductase [Aeromonas caviae]|uniref:dihydrofolate reductase n=1 Tax=Aeromonas caviae TaxID=648 RepID=UPI001CC6151D|nr:dihydrofolate reductase [Aeromonas caviae]GJC18698.1 hypothetical protein KAM377_21800 [Aeromonas caviae]